jgi:aminoglycoside phosphotransferase (APT) family kinase protein
MIFDKFINYMRSELKNPDIDYQSTPTQLHGGYETKIFCFQLTGAKAEYTHPLVLRLYPEFYDIQNAIWESSIQNVLADEGYPAARVHFVCTDISYLGGAFLVMDLIPGQPLMFAHPDTVPALLGETHAALHQLDPKPFINALERQGFDDCGYRLNSGFAWFKEKADSHLWARESVEWLIANRPSEPECLSVCHGDFHPINLMVKDGQVSGVLDWGGFRIADPVFDVANTIVLTTIPAKHLSSTWEGFPTVDWDLAAENYLAEYQTHKELDPTNLDFYRVRRCLLALIQGFDGQQVWQHPPIVRDLLTYIHNVTGIQFTLPN